MACEVADGLRPRCDNCSNDRTIWEFQWPVKWPMVCALNATSTAYENKPAFQWPVKWPMVCASNRRGGRAGFHVSVSMACEVADGLRRRGGIFGPI